MQPATIRRLASSFLAVALLAGAQDDATFSTDVKVVNIFSTVSTKRGEIIRDLSKDDFALTENGRAQEIKYFSRESDLPLTLGLLVDTSMSQQRVIDAERGASMRFLDRVLRQTKDQVFILQFDFAVRMRQELTSSRRDLEEALAFVDTPDRKELSYQGGGGTLLYDAVLKAAKDIMNIQKGRKACIVLSDGVDTGSDVSMVAAIEAAQRTGTIVYSILFADSRAYGFSFGAAGSGRNALLRLARETGGSFFEVSKKLGIEQIFDLIQEELRSQYSLGYVSDQPVRISEFRKVQLTTRQKDLVVHSRDKYWAQR